MHICVFKLVRGVNKVDLAPGCIASQVFCVTRMYPNLRRPRVRPKRTLNLSSYAEILATLVQAESFLFLLPLFYDSECSIRFQI
jgi:hypothetical protein